MWCDIINFRVRGSIDMYFLVHLKCFDEFNLFFNSLTIIIFGEYLKKNICGVSWSKYNALTYSN